MVRSANSESGSAGSVRAVLAILVFGTVWALLVAKPDRDVPEFLRDLLFVILGHYFAARRRAEDRFAHASVRTLIPHIPIQPRRPCHQQLTSRRC